MICIFVALSNSHYADYKPINGTFQNYNPVRRFLDGQVLYKDFQDYLGLGHLYLGTIFTLVFGGSYRSSLIAFSFLTTISFALCAYAIGLSVFKKKEVSAAVVIIITVGLLGLYKILPASTIKDIFSYPFTVGNSARFVRGIIIPISSFLLWGGYKLYSSKLADFLWFRKHKNLVIYAGCGLIGGFAFTWSNDFGISSCVCLIVIVFWTALSRTSSFLRSLAYTALEIVFSILGLIISVEILTLGHFSEWLNSVFGTGGYQSWYYNSDKSYYLYDVLPHNIFAVLLMLVQSVLVIVYMIMLFRKKGTASALRRYGILAFFNMVSLCAVCEYRLLSGNFMDEVMIYIIMLTLIYEICSFLCKCDFHPALRNKKKYATGISITLGLLCVIFVAVRGLVFEFKADKEAIYIEALGGDLTKYGDDLIKTNEFLDGASFFSTYASAQEVVSQTFQPSGTDYVIHVLGDSQRDEYLKVFQSGNFKYAATIKETYSDWEYWCKRANWFFYRELYKNWHPVYSNTYELYWEQNDLAYDSEITEGYTIEIADISESSKKVVVKADNTVNGIADVFIDAQVNKKNNIYSKLLFRTLINVENTGNVYADNFKGHSYDSNYLKPITSEYIPISIVDGYGEVTITSEPEKDTTLQLNSVSCERIFTVTADYVEINGIDFDERGSLVKINNENNNANVLAEIKALELQGKTYFVDEISRDDSMIYLKINSLIDYNTDKSNFIRVIH